MELMCYDVLFISSLLLISVYGQYTQSPCPEYFEYRSDETEVYGVLHVYPKQRASSITTKVNFTVATRLPSAYLGRLEPQGSELALIQQFNRGQPIDYRLYFPVTSPVPQITSIEVNDDLICSGPGDIAAPQQFVTRVGLRHTLFLKGGSNVFDQGPQNNRVPVFTNGNGQDFPSISFENINRPTWSNTDPFFIINNSQIEIDSFNQRKPTKPFDYTIFYPSQTPREPVYREPSQPITRPPPTTQQTEMTYRPPTTQPPPPPPPRRNNNECGVNGNIDSVPLIYNGMSYNRGEWPWLVAIFKRKDIGLNYICSGTLVSNLHVITAAHCMHRKTSLTSIKDIVVKAGVYNILDWGDDDVTVTRNLAAATIHDSYNASTLANDILLLTFTRTIEFNTYIRPACLWNGNTDLNLIVGAAGVVTGWGVSEIGPAGKGEPRMVRMPVVSTATCRASKPDFFKLTSSKTLCAGDRNGAGPCLGDSGGGLYMLDNGRWKLRGIVSLSLVSQKGDMSCNLDDYVVFTDAAQYLTWISNTMAS
ncbi:serine protease gd-like [Epargyreus clarus]|uniref:serine protease gd-like n=1 Tax=Epargyreus clarus TaxID=520877 RepID=UPI003C2C53FB